MRRKLFVTLMLCVLLASSAEAQDWAGLGRYRDAAAALAARGDRPVVFMGNSITDFWIRNSPDFFYDNGFICRGISGQTTPQMLIRFRSEVVAANARAVVILAGTNDIAGNTGPSTIEMIVDNIASMCDIARSNGARPIVCSVLPAHSYWWPNGRDKHPETEIPKLNAALEQMCSARKIDYVDYFSAMVDSNPENLNGLPLEYALDGVHPTPEGYHVMESLILPLLSKEVKAYRKSHKENLRLMSYNIKDGIGMDDKTDYDRAAAVISDNCPDVVAIQELDSCTVRSNGQVVLDELADRTGLNPTYASAIDWEGGRYGIGILSREKPLSVRRVPLPGREESRMLLIAEFDRFYFCCAHLSLVEEDRITSAGIIVDELSSLDKPVFIAGDWNDTPESKTLNVLYKAFTVISDVSNFTCPADEPDCTIDYIAITSSSAGKCKVRQTYVPKASLASDHRPVVCAVSLD